LANALRARALALLARRELSRAELRKKLAPLAASLAKSEAELDSLLDELAQSRLQSDTRYTEALVHTRARRFGASRIAAELRDKGVAPELADNAMIALRADEQARALAVWRRKFSAPPTTPEQRGKQGRFLLGRGFSAEVVRKVLRQAVLQQTGSGENNDESGDAIVSDSIDEDSE
jgi:regulatory protein